MLIIICQVFKNMKIIFVAPKNNVPEKEIKRVEKFGHVIFVENNPVDIRKLKILKEKGDKILCPYPEPMNWNFPSEFIKEIPDLKGICLSTTSYNWIDGKLAKSLNIPLTNVHNVPNAVAEAVIAAMLAVARRYALTLRKQPFEFMPRNYLQEVSGKTLGIIGLGRIGSRIAELGKQMGMKVIYWSKNTRNAEYQYVSLNKLLNKADYIIPALELNKETENLLSKAKISLMKPSASLIATVNAGVVDLEFALQQAKNKKIYGFAFETKNNIIADYKGNVFVTPKNNWYTKETVDAQIKEWVDCIISVIQGEPKNVVN